MTIPKTLHYCFGMSEDFGGKPWSLIHYVCLKSAITQIKPEAVYVYYQHEPRTPWWRLTEPLVTKVQIEAPAEAFGRPLKNPAHRADVVRLIALLDRGGIYLDADVFVHRSFDPLLNETVVLGQEGPEGQFGIANAVMLSRPRSLFLTRWLDQYKWFRGGANHREPFWNEHSVQLPHFMTRLFPGEVTVLNHLAFYWPLWVDEHIAWIFKSNAPIDLSQSYASHLWESAAWPLVKDLTPGKVRAMDTNFANWAKPYLADLPDAFGADGDTATRLGQPDAGRRARQAAFQDTYAKNQWGQDGTSRFFSGIGSRGGVAATYVDAIVRELDALRAQLSRPLRILDIGCGDFAVGAEILKRVPDSYHGCDIVPELIEHNKAEHSSQTVSFSLLDAVTDPLPAADVCLVRQVLQHLPNDDIARILTKLGAFARVYITEGHPRIVVGPVNPDKAANSDVRFDWRTGQGRGVELDHPPFNLNIRTVCEATLPKEVIRTFQILA